MTMTTLLAGWFGPVVYVAAVVAVLALIGRLAVPRAERVPLREWRLRDIGANAVLGWRVLLDIGDAAYRAKMRALGL
jgi:hypothetical protein